VADEDLAAVAGAMDAHHRVFPSVRGRRRRRRRVAAASRRISARRSAASWIVVSKCMGPT
jgi:hypothetical protein